MTSFRFLYKKDQHFQTLHGSCSNVRHIPRLSSGDSSLELAPKCTPIVKGVALLSIRQGPSSVGHKEPPQ